MFHRSERLLLRPLWPEDWESVFGGIADEGLAAFAERRKPVWKGR